MANASRVKKWINETVFNSETVKAQLKLHLGKALEEEPLNIRPISKEMKKNFLKVASFVHAINQRAQTPKSYLWN